MLYQRGGFGREPAAEQMRFVHRDLDEFARLLEQLRDEPCGIAPHSLRAVPPEVLPDLVGLADELLGKDAPLHIHISEQQREVEECLAVHGRTPIHCLAEAVPLGARWSLVHATHARAAEVQLIEQTDTNLVLCPLTEAYLGDGLFPLEALGAARFAVGSDSNVRIDAIEELRMAEYGQRLVHRRRTALGGESDLGAALWSRTADIGARSLAQPVGALQTGRFADFAVLNLEDPLFAGLPVENVMDAWITAGSAAQLDSVWVGGERRVHRGELTCPNGLEKFAAVMRRIHA
ncbi:MAG: amidohydrolase family protein [Gammaproteobacteria bacterium]|nr:amidohydrolase family protein [Gammaproteobacteria bacterium]